MVPEKQAFRRNKIFIEEVILNEKEKFSGAYAGIIIPHPDTCQYQCRRLLRMELAKRRRRTRLEQERADRQLDCH